MWFAVTLMNYVLGGSDFSSRLMTEVRSKRGLTYGIGSSFGASLYQGAFRRVGVDEERERVAGARRDRRRDPQDEERRAPRPRSWPRARATTPAATRSSCRRPRASRAPSWAPSCTAWASPTSEFRAAHGRRRRGAGQGGGGEAARPRRRARSSSSARATSSSRSSRPRACATSASTSRTRSAAPRAPSGRKQPAPAPSDRGAQLRACAAGRAAPTPRR